MCLRDPGAGHEPRHRVPAKRDDDGRVEDLELAVEVLGAGRDLVRLRVAVVGRPALHDVGDEHLLAPPADRRQQLDQEVTGPSDERATQAVLVEPGALADEHDLRVRIALTGNGAGAALVEAAIRARSHLGGDRFERLAALDVGHAVASTAPSARYGRAPRADAGRDPVPLAQDLGELDGIGGRPLAEVVGDHPEGEAAIVGDGHVATDAPDVDLVVARGLGGQRVVVLGRGRPGRRRRGPPRTADVPGPG